MIAKLTAAQEVKIPYYLDKRKVEEPKFTTVLISTKPRVITRLDGDDDEEVR